MEKILHIDDIVKILGVDADTIIALIQSNEIKSVYIGGKYCVRESDLHTFLNEKAESQQLERAFKKLSDPKLWAEQLKQYPNLIEWIKNTDFPSETMGFFLKKSLKDL